VNELDEIIAWVRTHGPQPLPVDGWDHASVWGWDDNTGSLYAHLWCNTDDPALLPANRIGFDDHTPAITLIPTLAQYVAMAVDCDPWDAATALLAVEDQQEYRIARAERARAYGADAVVTLIEGRSIWMPPNF
jgi:hypothetical protein